jgi:hypothetical protein
VASPGLVSFASIVRDALDPTLTARGFAPGQGGEANGTRPATAQVTYCAAPDVLTRWSTTLPNLDDIPPGGCFDIVIDGSEANGIADVRLEGVELHLLVGDTVPYTGDLATDLCSVREQLAALLPT